MFDLNSQTNTPSLQCSFKLARVPVVTYYTEVFSGNVAKASVFDDLGWWLYLSRSVCFLFTEPGLCMNTFLFSAHTQNGKLAGREGIFSEFDQKVFWIIIIDYTSNDG